MKNRFLSKVKNRYGFSIVELVVVLAISAVLMSALGFTVYYFQKNSLSVEQIGQNLAGELRLTRSNILAVQSVNGVVPKAYVIELRQGSDINTYSINYAGGTCNPSSAKGMGIIAQGADVKSVADISGTSLNPVYIVYVSPVATFYAIQSGSMPSFTYNASNESCTPAGALIPQNPIVVTLTNGGHDYYVKIDSKSGAITPTPTL